MIDDLEDRDARDVPAPLSLRTARPMDLSAVDALLARSYPASLKGDYPPSLLATALPLISIARPSLLASGSYYVIDREGVPVAAGGWTRGDPWGGAGVAGIGHVRHVATDHRFQRQGIGRRLMGHVMALARGAGITRLECYATLTARPFYAAMGFAEITDILMTLRPGLDFPAVHMRAIL